MNFATIFLHFLKHRFRKKNSKQLFVIRKFVIFPKFRKKCKNFKNSIQGSEKY